MKKPLKNTLLIQLVLFALLLSSCSNNNDEALSKDFDIEILVSSTGSERLSRLETKVEGPNVNLTTSFDSKDNFPFYKHYPKQTIYEFTNIDLNVTDNSSGPIGTTFTPYDIEFKIKIDGEVVANKTQTIRKAGEVAYLSYSMQEFFR